MPWTDPVRGEFLRDNIPHFETAREKGVADVWLEAFFHRYFERFPPNATELQERESEMGEAKRVSCQCVSMCSS